MRLLWLPARPVLEVLGGAAVPGRFADLGRDLVVLGDDIAALGGGHGLAVGVAQPVGLPAAPAGHDPGQQHRGDVAGRGVVVVALAHQSDVSGGDLGVDLAGGVGGLEQGGAQQWVAGFGQPGLPGPSRACGLG